MSTIQWFPGHMTKAKREMETSLKLVDMVIEIRDARIPLSSTNPILSNMINNKYHLIILSKSDKADEKETKKWEEHFNLLNIRCISLDLLQDNVVKIIKKEVLTICKPFIDKQKSKGINPRAIRAMVTGIPNVGKSTLINKIARKKITKTADKPGVTRNLQWIKLDKEIELLDTPGILWPKFENENIGLNLAIIGSINDNILDKEKISVYAMKYMIKNYPDRIIERYKIELSEDIYQNFYSIARNRNLYIKGEEDVRKAMDLFIYELRNDKFSRITLEKLNENNK